jgi:hypothetical protein
MPLLMAKSVDVGKIHEIRTNTDQMVDKSHPQWSHFTLTKVCKVGTGKEQHWYNKAIAKDAVHHVCIICPLDKLLIEGLCRFCQPWNEFSKYKPSQFLARVDEPSIPKSIICLPNHGGKDDCAYKGTHTHQEDHAKQKMEPFRRIAEIQSLTGSFRGLVDQC